MPEVMTVCARPGEKETVPMWIEKWPKRGYKKDRWFNMVYKHN